MFIQVLLALTSAYALYLGVNQKQHEAEEASPSFHKYYVCNNLARGRACLGDEHGRPCLLGSPLNAEESDKKNDFTLLN